MISNNANIKYNQVSEKEQRLGVHIIDIAVCIHKALGPGLLESIYEKCFCYELSKRGVAFERQKVVRLKYDQLVIDEGLRIETYWSMIWSW
jgi:GxxExxY protein